MEYLPLSLIVSLCGSGFADSNFHKLKPFAMDPQDSEPTHDSIDESFDEPNQSDIKEEEDEEEKRRYFEQLEQQNPRIDYRALNQALPDDSIDAGHISGLSAVDADTTLDSQAVDQDQEMEEDEIFVTPGGPDEPSILLEAVANEPQQLPDIIHEESGDKLESTSISIPLTLGEQGDHLQDLDLDASIQSNIDYIESSHVLTDPQADSSFDEGTSLNTTASDEDLQEMSTSVLAPHDMSQTSTVDERPIRPLIKNQTPSKYGLKSPSIASSSFTASSSLRKSARSQDQSGLSSIRSASVLSSASTARSKVSAKKKTTRSIKSKNNDSLSVVPDGPESSAGQEVTSFPSPDLRPQFEQLQREHSFLQTLFQETLDKSKLMEEQIGKMTVDTEEWQTERGIMMAELTDLRGLVQAFRSKQTSPPEKDESEVDTKLKKQVEEQERLLAGYVQDNQQLVNEMNALKEQLVQQKEDFDKERLESAEEMRELRTLASGSGASPSRDKRKIEELREEISRLHESIRNQDEAVNLLKKEYQESLDAKQEMEKQLQEDKVKFEKQLEDLKKQKRAAQPSKLPPPSSYSKIKELNEKCVADQKKIEDLEATIQSLREELAQKQKYSLPDLLKAVETPVIDANEFEQLKQKTSLLEQQKLELQQESVTRLQNLKNQYEQMNASYEKRIAELEAEQQERESSLEFKSVSLLKSRLFELEKELDSFRAAARSVQDQPETEAKASLIPLKQKLDRTEQDLDHKQTELQKVVNESNSYRSQYIATLAELQAKERELHDVELSVRDLKSALQKKTEEFNALQTTVNEKKFEYEITQIQKQLVDAQEENRNLKHTLAVNEQLKNALHEQYNKLLEQAQETTAKTILNQNEHTIRLLHHESQRILESKAGIEMDQLRSRAVKAEKALESAKEEAMQLKLSLETLKQKQNQMEQKLGNGDDVKNLEKLRVENQHLRDQIDILSFDSNVSQAAHKLLQKISLVEDRLRVREEEWRFMMGRRRAEQDDLVERERQSWLQIVRKKDEQLRYIKSEFDQVMMDLEKLKQHAGATAV